MHGQVGGDFSALTDPLSPSTLALDTEEGEALARARLEVERLQGVLPVGRLCEMLARRYSQSVLQQLFPDRVIPSRVGEGLRQRSAGAGGGGDLLGSSPSSGGTSGLQPVAQLVRSLHVPPTTLQRQDPLPQALAGPHDDLGFLYVPLIQCTFPHSDQGGLTSYTRRNGKLELTIATSLPTVGLPYGVPARLLAIYTATEILRNRSREIYLGKTVTEFLKRLGVPVSSGRRGTVGVYLDQLRRLINTVFTITEDITDAEGRQGLGIKKKLFADEARLWNDTNGLQGSMILLAEPLYESMLERSAPLSMEAVRALRRSPLDLDVYAWLVYRLYRLHRRLVIPWSELAMQFGQAYGRERDFHGSFRASLKRVLEQYPQARVEAVSEGLCLLPSRAHIAAKPQR